MRGSPRRLLSATSWLLFERVVKLSAAFVTSVWVARYLGPDAYGQLAFVLSFALLFSELTSLGLNALLAREFIVRKGDTGTVMGTAVAMRLVAGLTSATIAVVIMSRLSSTGAPMTSMTIILAAAFTFRAGEVLEQYFLAHQDTRRPAMSRVSASLVHLTLSAGFILAKASVLWFAVAKALETLVMNGAFLASYRAQRHRERWRVSGARARAMFAQSWPLVLSGFGAMLNLKIDQIMLGGMTDTAEVGLYAAAVQLSEVWYFVPAAIMTAAFPQLVRLKSEDSIAYRGAFQKAFDAMLWLGILTAIAISLAASVVLPLIYGREFANASPILVIHAWGGAFIFMRAVLSKWIVVEGFTTVSLMTHGLGAVTNIVANLFLIPEFGGRGAAFASVLSYAMSSYVALFVWKRTWPAAAMMTAAWIAPLRLLWARRPSSSHSAR